MHLCAILAILISFSTCASAQLPVNAGNASGIDVGVLSVLEDQDTRRQWQPLLEGLSKALPHRQLRFHPLAPADMEHQLGKVCKTSLPLNWQTA